MKVLLDTNAYSALMEGAPSARRIVALAEHVYLPMPVIGELLYGFKRGSREKENILHLQNFLASNLVSLAGVDFEVCEAYARIGKELRAKGTPIPTNDHWISAIALRNHFVVMTRDRHFHEVAGLVVESWD